MVRNPVACTVALNFDTSLGWRLLVAYSHGSVCSCPTLTPGLGCRLLEASFRVGPLQRHQPVAEDSLRFSGLTPAWGLETPSRWLHVFSVLCLDDKLSYHLVTRTGPLWTRPHQWPIFLFIAVVTDSSSLDLSCIIALVCTY